MPRGTLDYSKWDSLDDEEEVRKDELTETSSSRNTDAQRQNNHIESMRLIAEWVKDAYPRLAADGVTHLVRFIALQHRGIHRDNTSRHVEITAFLEAYETEIGPEDSREHDDLLHAMLALGHLCVRRLDEADTAIRARANSVLTVVQGAINTLWASRCEGGPRALFSLLLKEPHGGIATKYRGYKYASEVVTDPPEDPRDRPGPEPTFVTKLGRAVFMQLAVGGLSLIVTIVLLGVIAAFDPAGDIFQGPLMSILRMSDAQRHIGNSELAAATQEMEPGH